MVHCTLCFKPMWRPDTLTHFLKIASLQKRWIFSQIAFLSIPASNTKPWFSPTSHSGLSHLNLPSNLLRQRWPSLQFSWMTSALIWAMLQAGGDPGTAGGVWIVLSCSCSGKQRYGPSMLSLHRSVSCLCQFYIFSYDLLSVAVCLCFLMSGEPAEQCITSFVSMANWSRLDMSLGLSLFRNLPWADSNWGIWSFPDTLIWPFISRSWCCIDNLRRACSAESGIADIQRSIKNTCAATYCRVSATSFEIEKSIDTWLWIVIDACVGMMVAPAAAIIMMMWTNSAQLSSGSTGVMLKGGCEDVQWKWSCVVVFVSKIER